MILPIPISLALEVTGFSNFLHPVTDDLLLGLGQSEDNEVKLELFDISDFESLGVGGADWARIWIGASVLRNLIGTHSVI